LAQATFVAAVAEALRGTHLTLDTSGYGTEADFRAVAGRVDLVLFDLKLVDPEQHRRYTGVDNGPIRRNLRLLPSLGVPWRVRVPLVPGITDTEENLAAIAAELRDRTGLLGVELLTYHRAAGGKYAPLGLIWTPPFDEQAEVNVDPRPFADAGLEVKVRC
jgi:pyruvate formate lyase activating enzyme